MIEMGLTIKKDRIYGEAVVTVIGLTRNMYGRPQYVLVDCEEGKFDRLKFPGLRFRAAPQGKTLEDAALARFEEQTGLTIQHSLGLRAVIPTRSRHQKQWLFRNIFVGVVDDAYKPKANDGRRVYLAEPGHGIYRHEECVMPLGASNKKVPLQWVMHDNRTIARIATDIVHHLDWEKNDTTWYQRIPCVSGASLRSGTDAPLGCGLAVASIMLLYQPSETEPRSIILLQRKGDKHPGYAGGKIETPCSSAASNIDPISCCAKEGAEEFGFSIMPRAMVCVAQTALDMPSQHCYNSIVTYAFVAEPTNPLAVKEALQHPRNHLEGKMEAYVVEDLDAHRDRISRGELRMPDMRAIGEQFYRTSPGQKIPLTQIISAGSE